MKNISQRIVLFSLLMFFIAASCGKGIHRQERTTQQQSEPSEKDIKLDELRTHIENLQGKLGETKAKLANEKYQDLDKKILAKTQNIEAQSSDAETLAINTHIEKLNKYIADVTALMEDAQTIVADMRHCLATINYYVGGQPLAAFQKACLDKEGKLMSMADMQALKETNESRVDSRQKAITTANKKIVELTDSLDSKIKPLQEELQNLENAKSEAEALEHEKKTLEADISRLTDAGLNCTISVECDVEFVTELLQNSSH